MRSGLAAAAPKAIRSDIRQIARTFFPLADALARAGYRPGQIPTPGEMGALESANHLSTQAKLQAATQDVATWARAHCPSETVTGAKPSAS
jgi:hypothetical protein